MPIDLPLPAPWPPNTFFTFGDALPAITWLVGANGTGKSRFLGALLEHDAIASLRPRLLSTDRLTGARQTNTSQIYGGQFMAGIPKHHFATVIERNQRDGHIAGALTLLHSRPDLRIRVEANLSQLLDRHIRLEMSDGALVPKVRFRSSAEYDMLTEECHGVLEILVLLANIYDDSTNLLLIDEPEQNLHPQYQAFVLNELQHAGKKVVLATHSPNLLAVKTLDDLRGVVCFHHDYRTPTRYVGEPHLDREIAEILPRMTEQHRVFFFARSPVFVEGYFDATVIAAIQRSLDISAEAAGSCLIPAMGKDEAGRYLMLCNALSKDSYFLFDLDALFDRRLRMGALQDSDLSSRIATAGYGELKDMLARLQRALGEASKTIEVQPEDQDESALIALRQFFRANASADDLDKRRYAVLVAIAEQFDAMHRTIGDAADRIRGLLTAVLDQLSRSRIHVLPGGALENYLPSYAGNRFKVPDGDKRQVAVSEQAWLANKRCEAEIDARYGGLIPIVRMLPSRRRVDLLPTLRRELADLLHRLIRGIRVGNIKQAAHAPGVLGEEWKRVANCVELAELNFRSQADFDGTLLIQDRFGIGAYTCRFDQQTQTNNPDMLVLSCSRLAT